MGRRSIIQGSYTLKLMEKCPFDPTLFVQISSTISLTWWKHTIHLSFKHFRLVQRTALTTEQMISHLKSCALTWKPPSCEMNNKQMTKRNQCEERNIRLLWLFIIPGSRGFIEGIIYGFAFTFKSLHRNSNSVRRARKCASIHQPTFFLGLHNCAVLFVCLVSGFKFSKL